MSHKFDQVRPHFSIFMTCYGWSQLRHHFWTSHHKQPEQTPCAKCWLITSVCAEGVWLVEDMFFFSIFVDTKRDTHFLMPIFSSYLRFSDWRYRMIRMLQGTTSRLKRVAKKNKPRTVKFKHGEQNNLQQNNLRFIQCRYSKPMYTMLLEHKWLLLLIML